MGEGSLQKIVKQDYWGVEHNFTSCTHCGFSFTQAADLVYHFIVIALCMAFNLSVYHQLITATAILCIIPPLSLDFVIITDMGSSYETGRQGLILVFSRTPQIVSTLRNAYKVPPSKLAVFPMAYSNSSHQCFLETLQLVNSTWFHAILSLYKFLSITSLPFFVVSAVGLDEVQIWIC